MKRKLLFSKSLLCLYLLLLQALVTAQSIGTPYVATSPTMVTVSFQVTNGPAGENFTTGSPYIVYLSGPDGNNPQPIGTFYSAVQPTPVANASAMITHQLSIPYGTLPGANYNVSIGAAQPQALSAASQPFALNASFSMPAQLNGAIKCQSPAITYYTFTITNTGSVPDSFGLTKEQSLYPLGSSFLSLAGDPITGTPELDPGESYTLMMLFETPNGTPPDNWSTTVVTATSTVTGSSQQMNISTYIYCGNNNSNLPNAPDMEIVKTASTANALVGDFIDYTITIRNLTTRNAHNPVIKDFIPNNADLISYYKNPSDPRNVVFSYNENNRTLNALVQTTMTSASMPLTIYIRVLTTCESVPSVVNSAEVFSVSGDTNNLNDVSSATTGINYSLQAAQVGRWTGNYDSDWFDCRNWSGGVVPNNDTNVTIPSGSPLCIISALSPKAPEDQTARCYNITIEGSAHLSMADAGLLAVAGNWNSDGNFTPGDGTVTFMGSQPNAWQYITDGTGSAPFYNLTIQSQSSARGLSVPDQFGIIVHHSLSLATGDIRLNGKSQLVQTADGSSLNPLSGTGKILADQQGQSNYYSYNYWSSPVGTGNSYTVGSILYDGTDPENPQPVNWVSGYNGSPTAPISLSPYWINKYQNASGSYASWSCIFQNGVLSAGQGYTMKGSGTSLPQQNYTFVGKPNNGQFTSMVSANNMNLSGNPYPCALDAHAFINDNISTTTGTLYFWEQFTTNSSHITANYEGGYATINLTGATPPVAPAGISSAGSSNRTPGRYVPLGQGFLLFGSATGGTITFRNSQRAFVLESDSLSNAMFRPAQEKRLRIQFTSPAANVRRELLLAFLPGQAGTAYDPGYDAVQIDTKKTDMYFPIPHKNLVIQARGAFNAAPVALVVKTEMQGPVTFSLPDAQGFDMVFLHDAQTGEYHDLMQGEASIYMTPGNHENRFSLAFSPNGMARPGDDRSPIAFAENGMLNISDAPGLNSVSLYDFTGKLAGQWNTGQGPDHAQLVLGQLQPGTYVARLSANRDSSIKVIIK